jgi:von Willebrand factor type A C-terminal domain/von Willebrand factor type A domain
VNAIVTISAQGTGEGDGRAASDAPGAEVIMIDVSGSMEGAKIRQARDATMAAVDCIRDGVAFAVVAGNHDAALIYPWGGLAAASKDTREQAAKAVRKLTAGGGTAIGTWIACATDLLRGQAGVRHAILLTDGKDEHEEPDALAAAVANAAGVFQCDCRGVGTDFAVSELRSIATPLLGTVDMVADPAHLTADFEAMMRQAMGRGVADVRLRVWTPQGAEVVYVKQVAPELREMTDDRIKVSELIGDYPTGAWGDESRDYHVAVRVRPAGVGDEMLGARVSVVVDDEVAGQALVRAIWTDDEVLSTRINRQVAHYTGQQELADAIDEGLEAHRNGDDDTAVVKLGRAVQIAAESGNTEMASLLASVVDVDDAATGRVRLRSRVEVADEMMLETRSTRTARVRK